MWQHRNTVLDLNSGKQQQHFPPWNATVCLHSGCTTLALLSLDLWQLSFCLHTDPWFSDTIYQHLLPIRLPAFPLLQLHLTLFHSRPSSCSPKLPTGGQELSSWGFTASPEGWHRKPPHLLSCLPFASRGCFSSHMWAFFLRFSFVHYCHLRHMSGPGINFNNHKK